MIIISVRQEYKSIKKRQDYRIELGIIYREKETSMDIRKSKDNTIEIENIGISTTISINT